MRRNREEFRSIANILGTLNTFDAETVFELLLPTTRGLECTLSNTAEIDCFKTDDA